MSVADCLRLMQHGDKNRSALSNNLSTPLLQQLTEGSVSERKSTKCHTSLVELIILDR